MDRGRRAVEGLGVRRPDPAFWRGRRVLLTGHSGFKGGWAAHYLAHLGANIFGLALSPDTEPNLYSVSRVNEIVTGGIGDIRDAADVAVAVASKPQIVLHMAAQPLVRRSVRAPIETFDVNTMGTARLLDALRVVDGLEAVLVVTTDKVYENLEHGHPFRENDSLGGRDPYSASKVCAEIVVASYARTYFDARGVPLATARGGNVIGGGDFSEDRIVPDVFRAHVAGEQLVLRDPDATRPWQHALDCVTGYLVYAEALAKGENPPHALNFGPVSGASLPVSALVDEMQKALGAVRGWRLADGPRPREMKLLALDTAAARAHLGFDDRLSDTAAIKETARWYADFASGKDMRTATARAIEDYLK